MWPTLRRLLTLWRGEWRSVALGLVCAFAYTALSLAIPTLLQRAIDNAIVPKDLSKLTPYVAAAFVLGLLRFCVNFIRRYATARIGVHIEARVRELLYSAYLDFPRAFFDRHATGQVVSRATNDLYPIRYFIGWGMVQGAQSAMMIVGAAILLGFVNLRLTIYTGLSLPLIGLLAWLFAHRVMPISRRVQQRKGDVTEAADEAVVGIEMVQAFGREDDVRGRFGEKADSVRDVVLEQAGVEAQHLPGLFFLPTLSIAAVVFFGGRDVINGDLTIGQFVLFNTILLQLAWPLESLGWITNLAQRALASAGRSFAWIEGIDRLPEPAHPLPAPAGPQPISFRNAHFAYADEDEVLTGVDLEVEAGEIVAVCGATGSGKTSLLNLAARLYDPTEGRVLLGGTDLCDLRLEDVRSAMSIVTQRPILFSIPLRDNLMIGRPDASWDEVLAASEAAGVAAFVDDLPDGYDTMIGERGVNLSGGQRQRVALARALLARSGAILMDDPLSAVDTETERTLLRTVGPALRGRTVLVATQRLSTVALADRAVVLRDGKLVEQGTPEELAALGGDFTALFGDETRAA
ncbi:MAG TPA: ABC transporter ATP-binding protein [Gaiellales bacterium]|jgi:ABC-type multidrug transport system fused ATPase/permease subunit|nr:ABC transporter ATP-binding protein [Gaiellales bacterium]